MTALAARGYRMPAPTAAKRKARPRHLQPPYPNAGATYSVPIMPLQPDPDLSLALAQPITLTRGPGSHLTTLMDAAILIRDLEPWRQARPVWDRAAGMILLARCVGLPGEASSCGGQLYLF
jgi:hypothetical protein